MGDMMIQCVKHLEERGREKGYGWVCRREALESEFSVSSPRGRDGGRIGVNYVHKDRSRVTTPQLCILGMVTVTASIQNGGK